MLDGIAKEHAGWVGGKLHGKRFCLVLVRHCTCTYNTCTMSDYVKKHNSQYLQYTYVCGILIICQLYTCIGTFKYTYCILYRCM